MDVAGLIADYEHVVTRAMRSELRCAERLERALHALEAGRLETVREYLEWTVEDMRHSVGLMRARPELGYDYLQEMR
jgi:hypothetical protein